MTTWAEILGVDGAPVRGEPTDFSGARDRFEAMSIDAQTIVDGFAQLADIGSHPDRLRGPFTGRLETVFSDVDEGMSTLPRVASEAATVFAEHHGELATLRDDADALYARALAAWNEKQSLEARAGELEGQMPSLFGVEPDDLEDVVADRARVGTQIGAVRDSIATQDGVLAGIREEWSGLRGAEDARDDLTGDQLGDIDLGDLEDPGFWDRVCNCVGDFLDAVGDFAVGVIDGLGDLLEGLVDVLAEAWDRLSTFAQYMAQTFVRRITNPIQTLYDFFTLTVFTEDLAAAYAILGHDGELYNEGPYCGEEASCIVGVPVPDGADAITGGHTILFAEPNPDESLVAHEMQHVYDIEDVGALGFYLSYGANYLYNWASGMSHDEAYENVWWEQRAYEVSRGEREPQGVWDDVWDTTTERLSDLPVPAVPIGPIPVPLWPSFIPAPWNRLPDPFPIPWP